MKYTTSLIIALLTLCSTQAFAGNEKGDRNIKNQVLNNLYHVDNHHEGVVNAKFEIDEDGTVDLESVESDNQVLREFVKHRLQNMVVRLSEGETGQKFNLNILFRKER